MYYYLPRICFSRAILAGSAEPYTLRSISSLICSCCLGCCITKDRIKRLPAVAHNTSVTDTVGKFHKENAPHVSLYGFYNMRVANVVLESA